MYAESLTAADDVATPLELAQIRRDSLVNRAGTRYRDFRQSLTPRYGIVWTHLLSGHLVLIVATVAMVSGYRRWHSLAPLIVIGGGCLYGYVLAYILLFFHEAAHYNLARDRVLNDRLANIFIGLFVGQAIEGYRPIHFDHHRYLGTPLDTERTYFDPLNVRFIVETLILLKTIKGLIRRDRIARSRRQSGRTAPPALGWHFVAGMLLNAAILAAAVSWGYWPVALAWAVGIVIVFPFLAAIRQLLEHRDECAAPDVDFSVVPHGAINRMFGAGVIASTLGGAGFNRHLLHHWEPQVSYTRLRDLERFLADTPVAALLEERRTSYLRTFVQLFKRSHAR